MTWDADEVGRLLDRRLADDPVRATILGTIRLALMTASGECWCAATPDGSAVAVRPDRRYPVALDGAWPLSDFDELAAVIDNLPELVGVNGAVSAAEAIAARLPGRVAGSRPIRLYRLDTLSAPADVQASPVGQAAAIVNCCGTGTGRSHGMRMHIGAAATMRLTPP